MKLRCFLCWLVLVLFVAAGTLTSFVSPTKAGRELAATDIALTMDAGMPCCPSDPDGPKDCMTTCPALTLCLAKCFAGRTAQSAAVPDFAVVVVALLGDDADYASQSFDPPARPPRG